MVMMLVTTVVHKRQNFRLGELFTGSYFFEPYNRKYLLIFACVVGAGVMTVILINVLFLTGRVGQ
jgi:hypothetical protein